MNPCCAAGVVAKFDINPMHWLGNKASESLVDGFTSMMMALWSASMWLMQTAFGLLDNFVEPNVKDPDLAKLYSVTLWISVAIALVLAFGQIGLAVLRSDGKGFATLAAGLVQYGVVLACWIGVYAAIIHICAELTTGILTTLLDVDSFSGYAAGDGFVDHVSGTVQATTLGVASIFIVIPAAFSNIIIMLVRSAALLILTATLPITAAGVLSEGTKSWMWKSVRWFLACSLMSPMLALVLGLGTQFAWSGMPDGNSADASASATNIGMSIVGAMVFLVGSFAPIALFRLFAFVDPGTASGASFRHTMGANGGVAGLLKGKQAPGTEHQAAGSGAATEEAKDGRTTAENGAEAETSKRWQGSKIAKAGGKAGGVISTGMVKTGQAAQFGTSIMVDVLGQSGIGNQGYYDTSHNPHSRQPHRRRPQNPQAFEGSGHMDSNDQGGAAHEIPVQRHEATEEGTSP